MISLYNEVSYQCSRKVTEAYSTSFTMAVKMLSPSIQDAIHAIYGFVRLADEIVDSFHETDQEYLINKFDDEYYVARQMGISMNPIIHAFQQVVERYNIEDEMVDAFMHSMKLDLHKQDYSTKKEYEEYIYGSADVVGLMCLKVFVDGNQKQYDELKDGAKRLGSAFQKVNFLRDLKDDIEVLNRSYFPHIDLNNLTKREKQLIISEIEEDFSLALKAIKKLPSSSRFGVYTAYVYYSRLLKKLKGVPAAEIMESRIRVSNQMKMGLLVKSYFETKLNLI